MLILKQRIVCFYSCVFFVKKKIKKIKQIIGFACRMLAPMACKN